MRIDIDTTHVVKVVLSRRNVEDLYGALERGDTHLTLTRSFGAGTKGVIVGIEADEVHYAAPVEDAEPYCARHDLFDCWLCSNGK